jgi:hypothetical protein
MKFDIWVFFQNLSRKFTFRWNPKRMKGILHEDQCTYMVVSRWILLRMRNISEKSCRENQNSFYRAVWGNAEKNHGRARQASDDNLTQRMRFAFWINRATNIHSEYVILIARPRQKWLGERASVLRYTYIACLVWETISYYWEKFTNINARWKNSQVL